MRLVRRIIDHHKELREIAAEALFRTAMVAENLGSTVRQDGQDRSRAEVLREAADRLLKDQFTLSVVGEFSRGKSTLINALLGHDDLLPTAIEPSTAAITVLTQGNTPGATVYLEDGTSLEDIPLADLPGYVSGDDLDGSELNDKVRDKVVRFTRAGKTNQLTVEEVRKDVQAHLQEKMSKPQTARVEVRYPSAFLSDGIRIVDTPGLGSVNPQHGVATRRFISESDAVLFLINTDPVISASECNFLTFLKDFVDQFLFVVTKIDRYSLEDRERSVAYTRKTIADYAEIPEPQVFPVSARLALEAQRGGNLQQLNSSGFPEFYDALDEFLIDGRGQRILREYVGTARMHAMDLRKGVELELQGIEMGLDELRTSLDRCREYLSRARTTRQRILEMLDHQIEHLVEDIVMGPTHTARLRLTSSIRDSIHQELDGYTWRELNEAAQTIPISVDRILGQKLRSLLLHVTSHLSGIREKMAQECFDILQQLDDNLRLQFEAVDALTLEEFAQRLEPDQFRASLRRISTATVGATLCVALADGFRFGGIGALVMLSGDVLARTAVGGHFLEQARAQVKEAVETPLRDLVRTVLGNVKQEVVQNLSEYCVALGEMLDRTIGAIEESMARLGKEMDSTAFSAADRGRELQAQLRDLNEIDDILRRARPA